ncbi:MAG: phosphate acyltransferase, partial [Flavobacteriales bacterium]
YSDIDVFDIEMNQKDPASFIETVKSIAPTFGGINLEDIKAPECFEIEEKLKKELDIPVMHDDQHGTAIITGAALLNALELANKKISNVKIVINGAGASAISCARIYVSLGAKKENILMFDSKGLLRNERDDLNKQKSEFASKNKENLTLEKAIKDSDVFLGLSVGGVVSKNMVNSMTENPIVFALANPEPEISYKAATSARKDIIMATGRSDNPNQVNNVLGFPFIFRGALDVRATSINMEMKTAASKAIAELAKETVPEEITKAYGKRDLSFGKDYIIPKPMDPRLISYVSIAVAKAAIDTGVARIDIADWKEYEKKLFQRIGRENQLVSYITEKAKNEPKSVAFADADHYKILKAAHIVIEEKIANPILLGDEKKIKKLIDKYELDTLSHCTIIDPRSSKINKKREEYGELYFQKMQRKGLTQYEASKAMGDRNHFGAMMVEKGDADADISGITRKYPDVLRPALQIIGKASRVQRVAGMHVLTTPRGP